MSEGRKPEELTTVTHLGNKKTEYKTNYDPTI